MATLNNSNNPKKFTGLTVGLIVAAVAAVAISFVMSKTLFDDLRFKNRSLDVHQEVQATLTDNVNNIENLKQEYGRLQEEGPSPQTVLEALPPDADLPSLAAQFEAMALLSDMQLTSIAPIESGGDSGSQSAADASSSSGTDNSGVVENSPQQVKFRATVEGGYGDFISLLKKVRKSIRPMEVTGLELQAQGEGGVRVSLEFATYYQSPAELFYEKEIQP